MLGGLLVTRTPQLLLIGPLSVGPMLARRPDAPLPAEAEVTDQQLRHMAVRYVWWRLSPAAPTSPTSC